jgi:hypothetical protein
MTLTRPARRALAELAAGRLPSSRAILRQLLRRGLAVPADPAGKVWTLTLEGQAAAQAAQA